jgi:hypothetical protein
MKKDKMARALDRRTSSTKSRRRWEDNIKMGVREIGWGSVGGSCEYSNEPSHFINML